MDKEAQMAAVVTISASYGAGGSTVGPMVAERLGLPFLDRAIPVEAARRLNISEEVAAQLDERAPTVLQRWANALAHVAAPVGPDPVDMVFEDDPDRFRTATESVLRQVADTTGAVVLGRCAMVVLGGRPDVLCVRLSGPVDARVARAMATGPLDEKSARQAQQQSDRARQAYARTFYRVNLNDSSLYHLILDSTAIDLETCVEIVVAASRARLGGVTGAVPGPGDPGGGGDARGADDPNQR